MDFRFTERPVSLSTVGARKLDLSITHTKKPKTIL